MLKFLQRNLERHTSKEMCVHGNSKIASRPGIGFLYGVWHDFLRSPSRLVSAILQRHSLGGRFSHHHTISRRTNAFLPIQTWPNSARGIVPYTVNPDGTYSLNDPSGNLLSAYEVPNYALLIQAAKTGATKDEPALVTAVEKGTISTAMLANDSYNSMQFRTAAGGLEVGSITMDAAGNVGVNSYWPFGAVNQNGGEQFHQGTFAADLFQTDPSGTFMKMADGAGDGTFDYVFGTGNGVFAVDTPNGAILAFKKAATAAFDPSFAGSYKAIYYQKVNANTGVGNVETGTPSLGNATLVIGAAGQVTLQDRQGNMLVQAALTPVADKSRSGRTR